MVKKQNGLYERRESSPEEMKYYARVGNSKDKDCVIFFKSEDDMIAFDNCHNIPPLNYKHVIDRGLNLHARIKQLNPGLYD